MSIFKPEKQYPKERALVAFDGGGNTSILFAKGPALEGDVGNIGWVDTAGVIGSGKDDPNHGIWIFECRPHFVEDYCEGFPAGSGELLYDREVVWREPKPEEWAVIQSGALEKLGDLWLDIPSLEDWKTRHDGEACKISGSTVEVCKHLGRC